MQHEVPEDRHPHGFYLLRNKLFNVAWLAEGSEVSETAGEGCVNCTTS